MLSGMRLKPRLVAAFLFIGLLPFAIIGMVSLMQAKEALEKQSFSQLEAVRGIKKAQIDRYFAERAGDMSWS
jgi:methyl-accepting chemotaxis protein